MRNTKKHIDPLPDEFAGYEEAAEFWDTHDTTDYPEAFQTVEVKAELRKRHYEVEIDEDVIKVLGKQAQTVGITVSRLATDMLRQQILSAA
ncbi:MAG: CopG family antitoxin [bacterium]|nr:CopG family antitoxin [bacterium]